MLVQNLIKETAHTLKVPKPPTSQADPATGEKGRRLQRGFDRLYWPIAEPEDLDFGEGRHEAGGAGRRGDEGQEGGLQESRGAGKGTHKLDFFGIFSMNSYCSTRTGRNLDKRFCKQFSESSLCLPGQQGSCSTFVDLSGKRFTKLFTQTAIPSVQVELFQYLYGHFRLKTSKIAAKTESQRPRAGPQRRNQARQ